MGARVGALVAAVWAAACGGDGNDSAPEVHGTDASGVTYYRDVAPIVDAQCTVCHRPGEAAPFPLLTYADVSKRARQIAIVTETRFMPPWLPAPGPHAFRGERRLSEDELDTLARWAEAGAPAGDPAHRPTPPEHSADWALGAPDLVARMPEAWTVPAEGQDVFRNFVIPLDVTERKYVRAFDLKPGNRRVVHHAVLRVDPTFSSRRLDELEPGAGYEGMYAFSNAVSPDGFFLGWTPGNVPYGGTEDLSWRLEPGMDLVLQLHLQPTGKPEPIEAAVGLYFAEGPPPLRPTMLRLGSETIDIAPGEDDYRFHDEYVLPVDVAVVGLYPHAHYLGTEMVARAHRPDGSVVSLIHIPDWDFNWQDDYRYRTPVRLEAGTRLEIDYTYDNSADNPQNPSRPPVRVRYGPASTDEMGDLWLQVLPDSAEDLARLQRDFFRKDAEVKIAGHLQMLEHEPESETAIDHGALGYYYLMTGRPALATEHLRRAVRIRPDYSVAHNNYGWTLLQQGRLEDALASFRRAAETDPQSAEAHNNAGHALLELGRLAEAGQYLERALELKPAYPEALNNLGSTLAAGGALDRGLALFRRAIALRPDYAKAHFNLGNALRAKGQTDAAVAAFREALVHEPDAPDVLNNLGVTLNAAGRPGEAIDALERALALAPRYVLAHVNLSASYRAVGRDRDALGQLRRAVALNPASVQAHNSLAWLLATHPSDDVADAAGALRHARRAAELAGRPDPTLLRTLAAAHARGGAFGPATAAAEEALALAARGHGARLQGELRSELDRYRRGLAHVVSRP